jgi:hypothetical protein
LYESTFRHSIFGKGVISMSRIPALSLAFLLAFSAALRGQVSTADVVGTITDTTDAVVAGAKITATNLATGLNYETISNNRGEFAIPLLPAGRYRIRVEATGFKTWNFAEAALAVGDRFRADAKMEVGALEQTIQVEAEAAALQTESATVGTVVDQTQVKDLPINGRNFIQLAQIVPGANNYGGGSFANGSLDDRRRSTTVSVNGRTGAENNFTIDGMDNNEKFIGSILVKPSMEALGEMRVVTNSFSAELTRTSGAAVTIVTKGGTNILHGSAFEYLRNEALDARPPNLAATIAKPPYKQHNFGGSVSGPIRKNQTFFFADWETYKVSLGAPQLATVPTLAMRQGDFSGFAPIYDVTSTATINGAVTRTPFPGNRIPAEKINPIALQMINLYPDPINSALNNNYQRNGSRDQTDNTLDTRIDHRFSTRNNFFGRYSYDHVTTQLPHVFPGKNGFEPIGGAGGYTIQTIQGLAINDTHTVSPQSVLVLRAGFSRFANQSLPQGYGTAPATQLGIPNVNVDSDSSGFPTVAITNFTGFGEGTFLPTFNFQNVFIGSGSLQYIRGSHILKFGGEVIRRQVNEHQSSEPRINFTFSPAFTGDPNNLASTGNAMASFLQGFPSSTSRNRYLEQPGYRFLETGWFFQDDWRATRWLTLNLGLRYDYFSPLSESADRIANFDFTTLKLIFPNQNGIDNVVGVHKDFRDFSPRFGFAAQAGSKTVIRGGFGINYTPLLQGTPSSFRNPPHVSTLSITPTNITPINSLSDPISPLTPIDPVNLSGPLLAVSRNYLTPYVEQFNFTAERQLPGSVVLTTSYVASLGRRQSGSNASVDLNGAPPGAANVQTRRVYSAIYPNVTTINTVINYFTSSYHALQTSLNIRARHGMTFNVNHTWAHTIDNSEVRYIAYATPITIKGSAGGDIRQRVSIAWNYDVPYPKSLKGVFGFLVRNWSINALGVAQSGLPFSVTQTGTQTNNATGSNRPDQVADFHVANANANQWFNQAAFVAQPANVWGSEGRNLLTAPGMWNFDVGVHREFKPKERITLQFRWESFDFTNTVLPNQPISVLGQPNFGQIITYTGGRQQQVALKVLF